MARIRSVHPGLFTDEAFVSLSPIARVLLIGLWTECDDRGAFEWKPLTIRMRVLPADNADVEALLEELRSANQVRKYTLDGKSYGAVRNFAKYQRPKKPKYVHPIDDEFSTYVGLTKQSSEPVPKKGEISSQMEEEGGNDDGGDTRDNISRETLSLADDLAEIAGLGRDPKNLPPGWCGAPMRIQAWLDHGWSPELIRVGAREAMGRKRDGPPDTVNYFEKPIARAVAKQTSPLPVVVLQTPKVIHGTAPDRSEQTGWKRARDEFRDARADLKAALADTSDGDESGGPNVRLVAAPGRG